MFIASFSAIFIMLGLTPTAIGSALREHQHALEKVAAGMIVAMGLLFVLAPFVARLNRELRVSGLLQRAGAGGPLLAGAAFAIAWTPCVGPTLSAILTAAALSESAAHASILLAFYSAGLAIPFLATALAFNRMTVTFARVKRHFPVIIATGGVLLVAMGVLIWTGELFQLTRPSSAAHGPPAPELLQRDLAVARCVARRTAATKAFAYCGASRPPRPHAAHCAGRRAHPQRHQ